MREPADRSEEDVQLIVRATADIKFFQRLTRKQHEEICREMKHEIVPAATTLFEQDDEGSTFYVVYCGCCKLYATDPKIGSASARASARWRTAPPLASSLYWAMASGALPRL